MYDPSTATLFGDGTDNLLMKRDSISLHDVFQDVFFSEDGNLLDLPPSEDTMGNLQPQLVQQQQQQQTYPQQQQQQQQQQYQQFPQPPAAAAQQQSQYYQQQMQMQPPQAVAVQPRTSQRTAAAAALAVAAQPAQYANITAAAAAGALTEEQKLERREVSVLDNTIDPLVDACAAAMHVPVPEFCAQCSSRACSIATLQ